MHQLTVIEPKWLQDVAPTFFKVADANKICELSTCRDFS
jgi:ATP-dependent RNA helicase DHX8/PRP22